MSSRRDHRYQAVVFRHLPESPDFTQSDQITLPGRHSRQEAWDAVYAELQGPRAAQYVGGKIRVCAA